MWPCLPFYSLGLALCLANMGTQWIFVEWIEYKSGDFQMRPSLQWLTEHLLWTRYSMKHWENNFYYLNNNNKNIKTIIANVYWTCTMYQALCQAMLCILFNPLHKSPCGRHYYYSHCMDKERCWATLWTLMWKKIWHLSSLWPITWH